MGANVNKLCGCEQVVVGNQQEYPMVFNIYL